MNAATERALLKAVVLEAMISILEDDVNDRPPADAASGRRNSGRRDASTAATDATLYFADSVDFYWIQ